LNDGNDQFHTAQDTVRPPQLEALKRSARRLDLQIPIDATGIVLVDSGWYRHGTTQQSGTKMGIGPLELLFVLIVVGGSLIGAAIRRQIGTCTLGILLCFIAAMFITPPDLISMLLVAISSSVFYWLFTTRL
jgi:hypothetical protein